VTYPEAAMGRRKKELTDREEMYQWLRKKPVGVDGPELWFKWGYDGAGAKTRKRKARFNRWLAKTHKEKLVLHYILRPLTRSEERYLD
jgi:hypothetical protein